MSEENVTPEEIKAIDKELRSRYFPRLVVFADVINRYLNIARRSGNISWLRTSALLFIVTRGGQLTPSELASIMLRSNYSITKLLDGLEKEGLIKRSHSSRDRRKVTLELTPAGLQFLKDSLKKAKEAEEDIKSYLTEEELDKLIQLTRKMRLAMLEKLTGLRS